MHIPKHGHHGQQDPHIGVAAPVYGGITFGMSGSPTQPTKPTQATEKPTQPTKPKPQPTKPTQATEKPTQPTKPKPQPTKATQVVTKKPDEATPVSPKPQPTKPTQATEKPTQPTKPEPQPTKATQPTKASQATKKPVQPTKAAQASETQSFVPTGNTGSITPNVTDSKIAGPATQPVQNVGDGYERKHIRKRDLQRDLDNCKKEALKLGKGSKAAQKKALKNLKKRTSKYMKDLDKFDIWKKWGKQPKNLNKKMKKVPNYKNMSKREILKDLQSTRAEVNKLEFGNEGHQAKILAEVKKRSAKYKKAVDNYKFDNGKRKTAKVHKSKGKRGPIKAGEKVKVNGRLHYDSWGAKPGLTEHNATMTISHTAKGHKYPVHVSTLKGLRQGWVKADEVTPIKGKSAKKGATVKVNKPKAKKGHTVYASIPNEPGSTSPQASLQY